MTRSKSGRVLIQMRTVSPLEMLRQECGPAALEVEAVAGMQFEELVAIENDLQTTREHVDELFALMLISALAGRPRRQLKAIAFHHVAPFGENLHGHPRRRRRP